MSFRRFLRTSAFLCALVSLTPVSVFAQQKGSGPFTIETEVKFLDANKSKGKIYFTISYSDSDAVIKIKNARSDNNCFSVGKRSTFFFKGIPAKKQVTYNGHMNFKILNSTANCSLVFDVEAKDKAATQSITKTIKLLEK